MTEIRPWRKQNSAYFSLSGFWKKEAKNELGNQVRPIKMGSGA